MNKKVEIMCPVHNQPLQLKEDKVRCRLSGYCICKVSGRNRFAGKKVYETDLAPAELDLKPIKSDADDNKSKSKGDK